MLIFVLVGAFALYYFLVMPIKSDVKRTEQQISALQDDKINFTKQINELEDAEVEIDVDELILENRIPRERNLDEYILSLQSLEFSTKSQIESVTFAYDSGSDHIEVGATEDEENKENTEATTNENEESQNEDSDEENDEKPIEADPILMKEKPESLEVLVVRISAKSPTFDDFLDLIEVIENQDRISIVSNLNFTSPDEEKTFREEDEVLAEMIEFQAELTTFYYPEK